MTFLFVNVFGYEVPLWAFYGLPFIPLLGWILVVCFQRGEGKIELHTMERQSETYATSIGLKMGFSFAGMIAVFVMEQRPLAQDIGWPSYYLLVSFLFYLAAMNFQAYKFTHREKILVDFLIDVGTLAQISAIVSFIIFHDKFTIEFKEWSLLLAFMVWFLNHVIVIIRTCRIYTGRRKPSLVAERLNSNAAAISAASQTEIDAAIEIIKNSLGEKIKSEITEVTNASVVNSIGQVAANIKKMVDEK